MKYDNYEQLLFHVGVQLVFSFVKNKLHWKRSRENVESVQEKEGGTMIAWNEAGE